MIKESCTYMYASFVRAFIRWVHIHLEYIIFLLFIELCCSTGLSGAPPDMVFLHVACLSSVGIVYLQNETRTIRCIPGFVTER